ncbi:MAG: hypothetical protein WD894_22990 [Pirellulales bacterium]
MTQCEGKSIAPTLYQELLGYLNFSSGTSDAKFLRGLNELYAHLEAGLPAEGEAFRTLHQALVEQLGELTEKSPAFRDIAQAQAVLALVFERVLPAYRHHHRDLLFHQADRDLFRPFYLARVCEAVLAEGPPWEEQERIVTNVLARLNDFIGHRPLAVLENGRRAEPYAHERLRPVPLYIAGAGVACGKYERLVADALATLATTDPDILRLAHFDPDALEELAFDPRAYDFNHPVNKRPNYHFGQWDPHHVDNQGRYRRFVVQQTLLDALLERVETQTDLPAEEVLREASVVLAGTILMAAGTSGSGPEAFDSSMTLSTLLPRIAGYRDDFYRQMLARLTGPHAERLRGETVALRQPFAAARQHLNSALARRRALQLQHVHLAILFARMGYADAATRQANIVPTASARMLCKIHCLLTAAEHDVERTQLESGLRYLAEAESLLLRGIECGAIVDPWTILGFGGQFSLFPAVENSVPDLRADDLLELLEHVFTLAARLWHQAVVVADRELQERAAAQFLTRAEWWDRFATTSVSSVKRVAGREMHEAAARVAEALSAWHVAGAAAADIAFWRPHVERFDSPHTYARVVEALLERGRLAESQALLMHWLSQAEMIPLEDGRSSFHRLLMQWLHQALGITTKGDLSSAAGTSERGRSQALNQDSLQEKQRVIERFFDHLEANAEALWQVPQLETARELIGESGELSEANEAEDDDGDSGDVYSAAYEDVIYRDSTADGIDAEMLEAGSEPTDYELEGESSRLASRLALLATVARQWKTVAIAAGYWGACVAEECSRAESGDGAQAAAPAPQGLLSGESVFGWLKQAALNRERLGQLIVTIERQPLTASSASQDALMEYDRRRVIKETLLEKVVATSVAMTEAQQLLEAIGKTSSSADEPAAEGASASDDWREIVRLWRALLARDAAAVRDRWPIFLAAIRRRPLLYVPLARGGDGRRIAAARNLQHTFRELLRRLPRLGLLRETCQLIQAARAMERDHPLGAGAVTEFDRLFEVGYKAIVECLIESSGAWTSSFDTAGEGADTQLIDALQQVTESLLSEWLSHSRTLRLSVLEKVSTEKDWEELLAFVQRYGHDLFTQRFFHLANLRAILHQGVEPWLERLGADPDAAEELSLVADLDDALPRAEAKKHLTLVIEAVVENFAEYRDYNATTTQSDRGELVYMLLDFLRVKVAYERIHWNLRPVMMAHEVLVRCGRAGAAELWRRAMAERTGDTAEQHLRRLAQLQKKYGMRLPTVADRLAERFVRPLAIDRVKALVKPAVEQAKAGGEPTAFEQLEEEASTLAEEPSGAGLDLPDWLLALEDEVDRETSPGRRGDLPSDPLDQAPRTRLSWHEFQQQLANWEVKYLEDKAS